jgi:hypothetical protein
LIEHQVIEVGDRSLVAFQRVHATMLFTLRNRHFAPFAQVHWLNGDVRKLQHEARDRDYVGGFGLRPGARGGK